MAGSVLLLVASAGATAGKPGQAYLGVHVRVESERPGGGARVERVVTGSPAERAGIEVRDVIVRFRGHEISDPVQLKEAGLACAPGQRVEVEWIRGGES
ncbi:MAG: PDZ domain-containing protein, partial [Candidatus Krumholzibacteriia bacterium]